MISIVEATPDDFGIISDIAYQTWPETYGHILSNEQLNYMLDKFYSIEGLNTNIENGHCFLLAKEGESVLGFASYKHDYTRKGRTKIPKIYILQEAQGHGIGQFLINHIERLAKEIGADILTLNVNRFNRALGFYQKIGFEIAGREDIKLDHGYLMEDYIMERKLP